MSDELKASVISADGVDQVSRRPERVRGKQEFVESDNTEKALLDFFEGLGLATPACSEEAVEVRGRPLLLISQPPRSGGSLLSQLLDGHRQLLVYPWEMTIGYPAKKTWANLDEDDSPDRIFAKLFDPSFGYFARNGYRKRGKAKLKEARIDFNYSPSKHYFRFVASLPRHASRRQILDTYFETFFRSWGQSTEGARYVVGFLPRLALNPRHVAKFFQDYPDGRLVSIMRDPADWFVSRRAHTKEGEVRYGEIEEEMAVWNRMAENISTYESTYGERFLLLSFKELVTDREGTIRRVCEWCGIDFDLCLLDQTFDGKQINPNTNFRDPPGQLTDAVLERKNLLAEQDRERAYKLTETWRNRLHQQDGWIG